MSDADLEEIRRARLQQLQQQAGRGSGDGEEGDREQQQRQREAEARQNILAQILTPEAADRLGRIRLVKESRANDVESRLIMMARSGQLRQKLTEDQLKEILGAVAEQSQEKEKIVVRRRTDWEDDDDDLLDL